MVWELHVSIRIIQWQGRGPEIFSGVPRVTELIPMLGTKPTPACTIPTPGPTFCTTAGYARRDACEAGTCTNLLDPTRKESHRAKQSKRSNWCQQKGTEPQMIPNIIKGWFRCGRICRQLFQPQQIS